MKTSPRNLGTTEISGSDIFTVTSTLTSMVMYVECLVSAGHSLEEAKERAIANTVFVGACARYREQMVSIIRALPVNKMSSLAIAAMTEATYLIILTSLRKRDTLIRRCAYHWFGLII